VKLAASSTQPLHRRIARYRRVGPLERSQERIRERFQRRGERQQLALARGASDVCWPSHEAEPLVTVRVATYDRGQVIVDRALASILRQTYERLEVLVVGDCCDEATERAVRSVRDPRIRFVNLPERGSYPADPRLRWMVAGTAPMNAALDLARGAWIAPCDDDDEFTDDHVERLLRSAVDARLEMVYSRALMEYSDGSWWISGGPRLVNGNVAHGSVLYSSGLRFMRHSMTSWRRDEAGDWNLWRRMRDIGVRIGYLDRISYVHYAGGHRHSQLDSTAPSSSPLREGRVPDWAGSVPCSPHDVPVRAR
jgi:glycosyltransferase involved in cell wall biosynthesis